MQIRTLTIVMVCSLTALIAGCSREAAPPSAPEGLLVFDIELIKIES